MDTNSQQHQRHANGKVTQNIEAINLNRKKFRVNLY